VPCFRRDAVDRLLDRLQVLREPHLLGVLAVQHRLEDPDPVFVVRVGENPLGRDTLVVQIRREERRVDAERQQWAGDPDGVVEVVREVCGVRDLVVRLDRGDETLRHHRLGVQRHVRRVETHAVGTLRAVRHRVVAHRVRHIRRQSDVARLDAVTEILAGRLAGRRDGPHRVTDEAHPLGVHHVLSGHEACSDLGDLRPDPVGVQRLRVGTHLGVVETEFLLEAHVLQQAAGDSPELAVLAVVLAGGPSALCDRVELVFESDDRLVVVERALPERCFHHLGVLLGLRRELVGIDRQHVGHVSGEIAAHTPPVTPEPLEFVGVRTDSGDVTGLPASCRLALDYSETTRPPASPRRHDHLLARDDTTTC
jgi:hypothetical protein